MSGLSFAAVLRSLRSLPADLGQLFSRHKLATGAVLALAVGALGIGAYLIASGGEDEVAATSSPTTRVITREVAVPEESEDLGFSAFATKNTTRVAGPDEIADGAAAALAVHPSAGGVAGPDAVTLVDAEDWPAGIAAASLVAGPVGAPVLATESGEIPEPTADALRALDPAGSAATDGHQAFVLGNAARPDDLDSLEIKADGAAELAVEIERLRERLAGKPRHLLLVSSDEPAFAMPAAAWSARSGDPVLFVRPDQLPATTADALERHEDVPVYVLGPKSTISAETMREIEKLAPDAERVGAEDPLESSIEFARYASGSFGWNINDPGHGFVIANGDRPLDAAVAAPLSAAGKWGPLLVTEDADAVPEPLRGYLLDLKPGYVDDPTRALYNHIWLIGDTSALSVDFQAQVDELAEVAPVTSGGGGASPNQNEQR